MRLLDNIYASKVLYVLIGISILYFLIKGVNYLIIGSYVPILFILAIIILVYFSCHINPKFHRKILRLWAILLIFWALTRLTFWLILEIDTSLTESHIREQFGVFQHLISLGMLGIGFGIFRELKHQKLSDNNA